jgi:molecular chaperone DnaJ
VRYQQGFFSITRTCSECQGSGNLIKDPCKTCHGVGRQVREKTLELTIPAGVDTGSRLRVSGEGDAGERGGPYGDLYVLLHVSDHEFFERRDNDLHCHVPITFAQAALGAEIKVPTLNGLPVTLKLPPGTPNGRTFRVRGRGASRPDGTRGDLLVSIEIMVPQRVDGQAKEALETFRDATSGDDVRADLLRMVEGG